MKCDYGCEQEATLLKSGKWCCVGHPSGCPAMKAINAERAKEQHASGIMGYDYNLLPAETKARMNHNKGDFSKTTFEYDGRGNHKKALIQERGHRCEDCGLATWKDQLIPLELEHSDGDNRNHIKDNLKLLCCNCHALTPTWRGRNKNYGNTKVSDNELLTALKECTNIRQALQKVGLVAKGGNYARAKKLIGGDDEIGST